MIAAMCKGIVFDADILCGGNENRTLRNVDEPVVVDIQVFMDAGGILHGIAVVACLEDDRALVGTASDMCAMLDDVVADLDILCRTDLPPDADVGCKQQCRQRHAVDIAVLNQNIVCLNKEAAGAGVAHGTAVDVQRCKIFGVGKRIADCQLSRLIPVMCIVVFIHGIDDKRSLLQKRIGIVDIDGIPGFCPAARQRMYLMAARADHRHGLLIGVQHMDSAGSTVDVQRIVAHAFHIAVPQNHLSRQTERMDTVRIGRLQTCGAVRNADAEVVKGEVLAARADGRAEARGTVDNDVLEQDAAAGGKIEDRVAVNLITDVDLMTDSQLRLDSAELQTHQMIADDIIIKTDQTCLLTSVGCGEDLLHRRIVVCVKRIVGRAFFVEAVGAAEMLKAGDREFVINLQIGISRLAVDGGDASRRTDGVIGVKEDIMERNIVTVIELKYIIVDGNRCCRVKVCQNGGGGTAHRQVLCAADGNGTENAVGSPLEHHGDFIAVIGNPVKDRLQCGGAIHAAVGQNAAVRKIYRFCHSRVLL